MIVEKNNLHCVADRVVKIAAGALVATLVIGASSCLEPKDVLAKGDTGVETAENVAAKSAVDLLERPAFHVNINSVGDYEAYFEKEVRPHEDLENRTLSGSVGFEIKTEMKEYWKDGELHEAITAESAAELASFVTSRRDEDGNLYFPDVTPSLLMAQQQCESGFILDATSGKNGKGSQVGIAQCSCKWTIDEVNKWAYIVGETEIETQEEARDMLLNYPVLSAFVQADLLQSSMDACPEKYADDKEAYALNAYRWGANDVDNHDSSYSDHVRETQDEVIENHFGDEEYDR